MKASEPLTDSAQASPRSQRRRTAANAAVCSPTRKRTQRATRTPNKTAASQANGVEEQDTPSNFGRRKRIEAIVTDEVPPVRSKGAIPKKTKQRKELKQETKDTQEQEPQTEETSTKAKRKRKIEEDQEPAESQVDGVTPKTAKRKTIVKVEEAEIEVSEPSPKKTKRNKATAVESDETVAEEASPEKAGRKTKVKKEGEEAQEGEEDQKKKTKRKRKTREEKEIEAMPLAARADGLRMFIGAHVSGAKGRSFSMYIALVELRLCCESRRSQFSHKLRPHWVGSLHIFQK